MAISRIAARPIRAAFISTFVPRECGIATFSEDVINAVSGHGVLAKVVAMNRPNQKPHYDRRVIMTVDEDRLPDYLAAAAAINRGQFDILSVQHEFGIFGGTMGKNILTLLRNINAPVVTTFHTVLEKPTPDQYEVLREVARLSNRVVVMSEHSRTDLRYL
jgi:hypothetical protein